MITKTVTQKVQITPGNSGDIIGIIVGEDVDESMISEYISSLPNKTCSVIYRKSSKGITPVYDKEELNKLMR